MQLRGLTAALGVAETCNAAWLLSHTDRDDARRAEQPLAIRLAPLPLNLIDDTFPKVVKRLEKTGIRQFRQLLDIPLPALGKRCGEAFLEWLNQLQGNRQEPAITYQPPERFEDTLWFGFDIQNQQELHPAMRRLLDALLPLFDEYTAHEWRYRMALSDTSTFTSSTPLTISFHIAAACGKSILRYLL